MTQIYGMNNPQKPKLDPGERAIGWISKLTLSDDFAGKPFTLHDWQKDIIRRLFGTLTPEGLRQFRTALLFIPRKNAKTQLVAAIAIYWLFGLGKEEQEVILGTSSIKQSKILYKKIISTIRRNPHLSKQIEERKATREITIPKTGNTLTIVSDKGDQAQGFNPSLAILDELHTLPGDALYRALTSGGGTRLEPLTIFMTTAGNDRESICYKEYEYACKVRDDPSIDPSYLPIIYEASRELDIHDPATWKLANPALGAFMQSSYLESRAAKAKIMPSAESEFRQYHLNQWVRGEHKWMNMDKWYACGQVWVDPEDMRNYPCYAGYDLAESSDLTAFVMVFDMGDGTYRSLCKFWITELTALASDARGNSEYVKWAADGYIDLVPGEYLNHDDIANEIIQLSNEYQFEMIYYDKFKATQSALKLLAAGLPAESFKQNCLEMNEPTKYLEWIVGVGRIEHGNHPVLNFCTNNALAIKNRDGFTMIGKDKGHPDAKVDGVVSLIMGVAACTLRTPIPEPELLIYDISTGQTSRIEQDTDTRGATA